MDLLTCAKDIYSGYQYKDRWKIDFFWKRANTLEACIRFINAANKQWPDDPDVQQMGDDLIERLYTGAPTEDQFFQPWLDSLKMWADDYFWCGAASLSAYHFLLGRYLPGDPGWEKAQRYLSIAQTSWLRLVGTGHDLATEATPVPHGCRNSTALAEDANSIGIKNTVTNAGLFLLSLRLYDALKNVTLNSPPSAAAQGYLKMAYAQYIWFSQWFKEPNPDTGGYLKLVDLGGRKKGGLVHDRPQGSSNDLVPYEVGCVWSGDQGLVLAALAEMLRIQDDLTKYVQAHVHRHFNKDGTTFQDEVSAAIGHIAAGTRKLLFGTDNIVREAPFRVLMQGDYSTDYASGRGVLLRCLALPEVKKALPQDVSFDDELTSTANAVCKTLDSSHAYQVDTNLGVHQDDTEFQKHFKQLWTYPHETKTISWTDLEDPGPILQAVGLDVLGAAIPLA